jgi:hypothetical protein
VDDSFFGLNIRNVEIIKFELDPKQPKFSADTLTGYLSGTPDGDNVYTGKGNAAAIQNLSVNDTAGNDQVIAENVTADGAVVSYDSVGIRDSNFNFGDGIIQFYSKINQGYYANGVSGGSLRMGSGPSFTNIQAVEDSSQDHAAFVYGVTGINNWDFSSGAGRDILNVAVTGSRRDTFSSVGISSGSYDFGDGDDLLNVNVINRAGSGESVGISSTKIIDVGDGNDLARVISTGY